MSRAGGKVANSSRAALGCRVFLTNKRSCTSSLSSRKGRLCSALGIGDGLHKIKGCQHFAFERPSINFKLLRNRDKGLLCRCRVAIATGNPRAFSSRATAVPKTLFRSLLLITSRLEFACRMATMRFFFAPLYSFGVIELLTIPKDRRLEPFTLYMCAPRPMRVCTCVA